MSTLSVQGSDANQAPISTKTKIPKLETADPKGRALEASRPGPPGTTPRKNILSTAKDCIRSRLFLECSPMESSPYQIRRKKLYVNRAWYLLAALSFNL